MTKITFCIPFYAGTGYLEEAVRSVLSQTLVDWRLIVVDDCGPDGAFASRFIERLRDTRVTYVRNEVNLGLARNWNRCLDLADTDLVQILHADDRIKPGYGKTMIEGFACFEHASVLFCNAEIIDERSQPKFSFADWYKRFLRPSNSSPFTLEGPEGVLRLVHGDFVMCPTMVFRKSKIGERRFNPRWRMVVDLDFKLRLLLDGDNMVGLPDVLYEYRRHSQNQTSLMTQDLQRFREEVALLSEMASIAHRAGWKKIEKVAGGMRVVQLNLCYCIVVDVLALRFSDARKKIRFLFQEVRRQA